MSIPDGLLPAQGEKAWTAKFLTAWNTMRTTVAGKAASVHTHTAEQISNASTFGRSLVKATTAAAARAILGALDSPDGSVKGIVIKSSKAEFPSASDPAVQGYLYGCPPE